MIKAITLMAYLKISLPTRNWDIAKNHPWLQAKLRPPSPISLVLIFQK